MLKQCTVDHYSGFVGEVRAGDIVDLPETQDDGSRILWPEEFWTDPPTGTKKITTPRIEPEV